MHMFGKAREFESFPALASEAFRSVYGQLKKDLGYKQGRGVRWRPTNSCRVLDFNHGPAIREAIDHVLELLQLKSYAQITTIHETRDHWGKPYERYEMKLVCGEAYLVDFYCAAATIYKKSMFDLLKVPTDARGIAVIMRMWVSDHFSVELPIYTIDQFKFRDTGLWLQIERGLGLPKDVALNNREYYFTNPDHEFRRKFFEYRGKQA